MKLPHYPGGIWAVDFEFHPAQGREGNPPVPVCMVAHEVTGGRTVRLWREELFGLGAPPFPVDSSALFVAYYASAEFGCFHALGWPMPANVLDLFAEFRCKSNGQPTPAGNGLIGALAMHGLDVIDAREKDEWRSLILSGGPWSASQRTGILDYCQSDTTALAKLLAAMAPGIDWPRALLRGQYSVAAARIESHGIPIDTETLGALRSGWDRIQLDLISAVDANFGVYEGAAFRRDRFERYLQRNSIAWPRLPSGDLDLDDDTFRDLAGIHPRLAPLRELRGSLSQMRRHQLAVGDDGRNRCLLSMYRATTGRNQPSSTRFAFGPSVWLRGLIRPAAGYGLAYVDWSQQEFGIAAALSQDEAMMRAYQSGDPYLAFAKEAGVVPNHATKESHSAERDQFKQCVLAVQYGMSPESLAYRINQPTARARELLALHRRTFHRFWDWSQGVLNQAVLGGRLWTTFGWPLHVGSTVNGRSICNFPVQANGAEMLRLACTSLTAAGVQVCAPVHDAILIEAPLTDLDEAVATTQETMRRASATVLDGFTLESDVKRVAAPERYMDKRGSRMWNDVMDRLGLPDRKVSAGA